MSEQIPEAFEKAFADQYPRVVLNGVDISRHVRAIHGLPWLSDMLEVEPQDAGWWEDHPFLAGFIGTAAVMAIIDCGTPHPGWWGALRRLLRGQP